MQSTKTQVEKILLDVQRAIECRRVYFIPRKKNMIALSALGLLLSDVYNELCNLSFAEYVKGPEIDRDRPASDGLWVFKKRIKGQMVYIKFKVEYQCDGQVRIISFHLDETI